MDNNSISDKFLSKFDIKGKLLYAIILWQNKYKGNLFHIQLFSEEQSWSGEFPFEMCTTFGENFDEDEEQYSVNVKDALKIKNNMYTFDFTPVEDGKIAKFYWKRRFENSTATLVHGFVTLIKDEIAGTKSDIIDFLLGENKCLQVTLEDYKNKTEVLKTDLENWKSEFEKIIDLKNTYEKTLYGKFVQLLNTKKQRIQELEDHLNDL